MADHPIRTAAATESGVVEDTLLEQIVKRYGLVLGPTESLGDIDSDTGEIPLCVFHAGTGYVYFYDDSDTTTLDDGLYTLVDGSGRRYHIQDSASISLNSVLSRTNTPPGSPTVGDTYIVGTSPTGAWASNANDVAVYTVRGWIFASPSIGLSLYNQDDSAFWLYDETPQWVSNNPLVVADGAAITDTNGNELFQFGVAASAVNHLKGSNAATGNAPKLEAVGDDTNIDLSILAKGTGNVLLSGLAYPNSDGAAGQAIVTDGAGNLGWASAGGCQFMSSVDLSGDSSVEFTNFDAANFDGYLFIGGNLEFSTDAEMQGHTSTNGGSSFATGSSDYYNRIIYMANGGTPSGHANNSGRIQMSRTDSVESTSNDFTLNFVMEVLFPHLAAYTMIRWWANYQNSSAELITLEGRCWRVANEDVDAMRFRPGSGTFSGSITQYGLRSA